MWVKKVHEEAFLIPCGKWGSNFEQIDVVVCNHFYKVVDKGRVTLHSILRLQFLCDYVSDRKVSSFAFQ